MIARADLTIATEQAMRDLGAGLLAACDRGGVIGLRGELGSGKTTLVRGALQARGITTGVRSPTYTLIEYYPFESIAVAHFDLYRLADGEELEYLGYRDYLNRDTLCLIEWPERAAGYLHDLDLEIELRYAAVGREAHLSGLSEWGSALLGRMSGKIRQNS